MGDAVSLESAQPSRAAPPPSRETGQLLARTQLSLSILDEQLRHSELASLDRVAALLQEHITDLGTYLSSDPKGKLIPRFLVQLAAQLKREHELLSRECAELARDLDCLRDAAGLEPGVRTAANGLAAGVADRVPPGAGAGASGATSARPCLKP